MLESNHVITFEFPSIDPMFLQAVMDTTSVENMRDSRMEQLKELSNWDQIQVPGMRSSMSMSDLVNHLEHRISEQGTSRHPILSSDEWQSLQMLDDINRCLFSEIQHLPDSDEKSLMSRVNSLCCLLQNDNGAPTSSNAQLKDENENGSDELMNDYGGEKKVDEECSMSRKDSVGELLLNLPRIASLPQFLFNISEDFENHAR